MNIVREEMNPKINQNFNYNPTYYNNTPTINYRSNNNQRQTFNPVFNKIFDGGSVFNNQFSSSNNNNYNTKSNGSNSNFERINRLENQKVGCPPGYIYDTTTRQCVRKSNYNY